MKFSYLSVGLLSLATFSAVVSLSAPQASAQCVASDINFQSSINGSKKPTDRTNDVTQASNGGCEGNSVTTTNVQNNVGGTDRAVQRRQSTQVINGNNNSRTGINMEPVKIKTNVQVDVDNPADRLRKSR
jgi:hypothetical protein